MIVSPPELRMTAAEGDRRLFATCFAAIVATSFCFILRALVVDDWGREFALSQTQKGELLGVGLWPFSISIVLLSLLIDRIGFRVTLWFAAGCHLAGLAVLLTAHGYWSLYIGTFAMALGNGAVEAAANPLIATLYSHDKAKWLNRLHAGWPAGLILGGLLALAAGAETGWRLKCALLVIPVLTYVMLLIGRRFPMSERVAAGVSYKVMLAEVGFVSAAIIALLIMLEIGRIAGLSMTAEIVVVAAMTVAYAVFARSAGRPLYIILLLIMIPLAITELSTDSWISSLMEPEMDRVGLQTGWVLVYTSAIVFVVRIFAGSLIHWLKPLPVLAIASAFAAAGLYMLSGAAGLSLLAAATLYGIGKSFFWATSLGLCSEQFPRGGAVAINTVAGAGMLAAGIIGSVMLGAAQDRATDAALTDHDARYRTHLAETYLTQSKTSIFGSYRALDPARIAAGDRADQELVASIKAASKKEALRDVAKLPLVMLAAYLCLIVFFRSRGGYRSVLLAPAAPAE
ncbi:MAG: MFS transporter [Caulobacteraceae bacterium]|nr:MFS transporter [Caulobacteraceae bacterium]